MTLRMFISFCFLITYTAVSAQSAFPAVDKSPLDISYYPNNYPVLRIQDKVTDPLMARVIYSRPLKNGRAVFGELIQFGKVWRLGANEATEIEFFQPVTIGAVKVKKGRYTIYAIPDSTSWTFILNKETDTWGSFRYDSKKDVARVKVPVEQMSEDLDAFTMYFEKTAKGFALVTAWEKAKAVLPISF